eukprot:TRINITY_DN14108_c0_g1_i1.p1 TRINITY_DN14108_c0_g1~~TRINITY_DN14108_c0_g1_i1.p1  ORF type:complete len:290 (+),score=97.52 TRINITY_DN14108_c0_g1_i1:22-870(+)
MLILAKTMMMETIQKAQKAWLKGVDQPVLKKTELENLFNTIVHVVCIASSMLDVFVVPAVSADKEVLAGFKKATRTFRKPGSDYLTALAALKGYMECKGNRQVYCDANFLSAKNLKDALELKKQLTELLISEEGSIDVLASIADEEEVSKKGSVESYVKEVLAKPVGVMNANVETVLRKLIACGLIDNVARRASPEECQLQKPPVTYSDNARRAPYIQILSRDVVFLHANSSVSSLSPAPEWVVYTALVKTKTAKGRPPRTVMKGVTAVKKEWLNELGWEGF